MIEFGATMDPIDFEATVNEAVSNDNIISILNGLIEICKDGQEGFKQAAEGISNLALRNKFYEYGQQREFFVNELQELVRDLGGNPENSGTIAGAIHRSWIDIKSLVAGKDENSVLNEVEQGEDTAKNAYLKALDQNLPPKVHSVVNNQFVAIKEAHDHIKLMRDADNKFVKATNN